jgi:hypothetical protein
MIPVEIPENMSYHMQIYITFAIWRDMLTISNLQQEKKNTLFYTHASPIAHFTL